MIAHLQGTITAKSAGELILDVHGVGFQLSIPLSTFETLGAPGDKVTVLTHLHVREDAMLLFGFATESEREIFRSLLSVSGIGPKMAQVILSGLRPAELRDAIVRGDVLALTSISGVGKKTAERIVLELRETLGAMEITGPAMPASSLQMKSRSEAAVALMALGYTRQAADAALRAASEAARGADLPVEELIKRALQQAPKQRL
jgi:Holliday junction DNA helicase RuvA